VSVYAIDPLNGVLTPIEREPVRGSISRNMALTADGQWALVAGQLSNTLAVFRVDTSTGELTYANQMASVPTPIAIVIED
jgi:6-phosphogluconolactonase